MSDTSQGPGWWQASDGKWYPPEAGAAPAPGAMPGAAPGAMPGVPAAGGPEQYADWGTRVVAFLIDWAIVIVVAIVAAICMAIGSIMVLLGVLLYLAAMAVGFYFAFLTGETGQSPGKRVMGIKVVDERTGQPIGGGMGIVRHIAHVIDSVICYIGFLFPLWDPKRQTLADKVLNTVVLPNQPKQPFGPEIFKP